MGNYFVTGDTHGNFERVVNFCHKFNLTEKDTVIILGDAGINYYGGRRDKKRKKLLSSLLPTFFCIHGNHEKRPHHIESYTEKEYNGGIVLYEENYPNILFPKDGEIFDINGKKAIVIGGAYSVDKFYRLQQGWHWFSDEQPSDKIKQRVEEQLDNTKWQIDYVLTHTCPLQYEPTEVFLQQIDQSTVDKSTEEWLEKIERRLNYEKWLCGHFHTSKVIDKIRFMFEDWIELI